MDPSSPDDDLFHLNLSKLVNRKSEGCKGLKEGFQKRIFKTTSRSLDYIAQRIRNRKEPMKSPPHPSLSPEGGGEGRVRGKILTTFA
jgi:hypothetical protein